MIYSDMPDKFEEVFYSSEVIYHGLWGPGLAILSYNTFSPLSVRFRFPRIFRWLMALQVKRIVSAIGEKIDIVWCFDPNLFLTSLFLTLRKRSTIRLIFL